MDHSPDISKQEALNQLQVLAEKKLKGICMTAVTKAEAVKSDTFGFGATIHRTDPQQWNTVKKDWNDTGFVNLPVEIEVDVTVIGTDSIGQIINAKKEQPMSTTAIALIMAFVVILSIIEAPKMPRWCLYKELVLYSVLLLIGVITGILVTLDVKILNPPDSLVLLLSSLVTVVKFILG